MILRSVLNCSAELLRHRGEILLLVKRLPKQLPQLGVNRLRIIVTQKTEARVDLFLEQNTVCFGETRQHLDQQGQQVWPLRDAARLAQSPAHPAAPGPPHPIGKRSHPLHRAIDFICDCGDQFCHLYVRAEILPKSPSDAMRGYEYKVEQMNEIRTTTAQPVKGFSSNEPF